MRKIIGVLLLIVSLSLFATGGFLLYDKMQSYEETDEIYKQITDDAININLSDINITSDMTDKEIQEEIDKKKNEIVEKIQSDENFTEFTIDWEQFKGKNVVGWVKLGRMINYPIVQAEDNSYYLTHTVNGNFNHNGSIFMSAANDKYFRDKNTVIYGHNLKSGQMFGCLKFYEEEGYGATSFCIYMPDGTKHTYDFFSVAEVKDEGTAYKLNFKNTEDYKKYQEFLKENAQYETGIKPNTDKQIVTLSTCRSTGSSQGWRVIVAGIESKVEQIQAPASWYKPPVEESTHSDTPSSESIPSEIPLIPAM